MLQFQPLKLEVSYPDGARHVVELAEGVSNLGRDPASDLVLYDTKCSRRHAVLESTSQGTFVRDAGSANGTFVNGRRAERATLMTGDVLRLGDVSIRLLDPSEPVPDSTDQPPEGFAHLTSDTDRGVALLEAPALAAKVLGLGWLTFAALFAGIGIAAFLAFDAPAFGGIVLVGGLFLAAWAVALGVGWLRLARWVRPAQFASSVVGLLLCPLTATALVTLVFTARGDTANLLQGGYLPAPEAHALSRSDRAYAFLIAVCLALSALLLTLGAVYALSSGGLTIYGSDAKTFVR